MHLFECPFYNDIRLKFNRLFSPFLANKVDNHNLNNDVMVWNLKNYDIDMKFMMNGINGCTFWEDLANYLLACKKKRAIKLDTDNF